MKTYLDYYEEWLQESYFDDEFKHELLSIGGDQKEIEDRFGKDLAFGTAGMRGIMGAGKNRMNKYIIRKVTQAYTNFLINRNRDVFNNQKEKIVAISYDPRHHSKEFAHEAASVLAGNGFTVYIYDGIRTTPQLSYTVRKLGALGGIMITASHNLPIYNGYKVYDENGCQLVPELTDQVSKELEKITDWKSIYYLPIPHAIDTNIVKYVSPEIDQSYIQMVKSLSLRPKELEESLLRVVFTPLHGASGETVMNLMRSIGKKRFITVDSQIKPDPDFPTIQSPNPENREAFEEAGKYMRRDRGDMAIAIDPDGDRLAIMTKKSTMLTGNQMGALFADYILSTRKEQGTLREDDYIVTTVVSSDLVERIAEKYGVQCYRSFTGFKFIGEVIEEKGPEHFIMGYEESIGFLFSPEVRDKDAIQATLMAMEMATHYGKGNLEYALRQIYKEYGYHLDYTDNKMFTPEEFTEIMNKFRVLDHHEIGATKKIDYLVDDTGMRKSNLIKYYFGEKIWVVVRPSGTEPKLKVYYNIVAEDKENAEKILDEYKLKFNSLVNKFTM